MDLNIPLVLKTVLDDYVLPLHGDHGVIHWARVLEKSHSIADSASGLSWPTLARRTHPDTERPHALTPSSEDAASTERFSSLTFALRTRR